MPVEVLQGSGEWHCGWRGVAPDGRVPDEGIRREYVLVSKPCPGTGGIVRRRSPPQVDFRRATIDPKESGGGYRGALGRWPGGPICMKPIGGK